MFNYNRFCEIDGEKKSYHGDSQRSILLEYMDSFYTSYKLLTYTYIKLRRVTIGFTSGYIVVSIQ